MTDEQIFCLNGENRTGPWTPPFGIKYMPSAKQLEAHLSQKAVRVLVGGRGSGKTTCMFMELLKRIDDGEVKYAVIHCDHILQSRMYAQAFEKIVNANTNLGVARRHYEEFAVLIGMEIVAKVVFAHGEGQWAGIEADLTVAVTGNGDLAKVMSRLPRSKKYLIDFAPGELLRVDFLGSRVDIFDLQPNPELLKSLYNSSYQSMLSNTPNREQYLNGSWDANPDPCLCCENPTDTDVPGRAAIEETIRQAKARGLGDAASDPFEMEGE